MRRILGVVAALATLLSASGRTLDGAWAGTLEPGNGMKLRLVFNISAADSTITMDSPDQGARGIAGQTLHLSADSLSFSVPSLRMTYSGKLTGNEVRGTFRQGPLTLPLTLTPGTDEPRRPQTPNAPFPYSTEEVSIANPEGGSVLAGTLTVPDGATAATPVALLVSGSGLQNRDEELFGHKPFAVIADYLARNGIASLRYDDRGFGASTGNAATATTDDFASDASAALKWLGKQKRFGRTGIIGHSEGGIIAYMLGAGKKGPDFIVSIAGPAVKGTRTIANQNRAALTRSGISEAAAADFEAAVEKALELKLRNPDSCAISDEQLAEIYPQVNDSPLTWQLGASIRQIFESAGTPNPWMLRFWAYDPAEALKKLKSRAFIIYGEKDRQVDATINLPVAKHLAPRAKVKEYAGLNHLMQHATTGHVDEYASIEETFAPEVLADIVAFIKGDRAEIIYPTTKAVFYGSTIDFDGSRNPCRGSTDGGAEVHLTQQIKPIENCPGDYAVVRHYTLADGTLLKQSISRLSRLGSVPI